ncbi:uncharacterized protein LOC108903603 [Anoplophora glabripennis]|uniref:uncharacterized protein LOC108903603 n=1 Tax=Anoplophora glabripennis TaxID=217634 RepID=UPI000874F604|nr:uncharacterized protein LOC108903603 [Anoplophora glabripennis]
MTDMDNELKALYSQFQGETLTNLLTDLNTELLSIEDTAAQLEKTYEKLKQSPNNLSAYERPKILKLVFADIYEYKDFEEINKKLANKKRNVQILSAEYNKKMELLQKLS